MPTTPRRTTTAWGREIEPDLVVAPPRPAARRGHAAGMRIEGLEKSFSGNVVLRGLDLDVPAGQFLAIVGKRGCGKSTLLRLHAGLDEPSAGTITYTGGEATRRHARIVFQEPRLLPWASVRDNVVVGLGQGVPVTSARDAALAALAEVQLADRADEWPSRLSGGQRQRVALARALVSRPDFLAMDEPLGALDALTRITMQALIQRVWQEQGFTAIFVTHDVAEAVSLADRVIVLDEGRVALDVPVPQARPRERGSAELAALEAALLKAIFRS